MVEFLKSYGVWIFLGLLFLMMVVRRGHGMGCGMGSHEHVQDNLSQVKEEDRHKHSGCC